MKTPPSALRLRRQAFPLSLIDVAFALRQAGEPIDPSTIGELELGRLVRPDLLRRLDRLYTRLEKQRAAKQQKVQVAR